MGPEILSPLDAFPKSDVGKLVTSIGPETLAQTLSCKTQMDPDLARLVEAWTTLPEAICAGIVAMVKAASGRGAS